MSETNTPTTENNRPLNKSVTVDGASYDLTYNGEAEEYFLPGEKFDLAERAFSGALDGIKYFAPQAKSVEAAIEKWGADAVLGLINDRLLFQVALKAKSKLAKFEDENERTKYMHKLITEAPYIINPVDALDFKPGERELSAKGWLTKSSKEAAAGNLELAMQYAKKAMSMLAREQQLQAD